jgi:DNA-binding MarR family transcriptional regulator
MPEKENDMKDFNEMEDSMFVFGSLFVIANKLSTLLDRELEEYDVTSKQWFLSTIVDSFFDEPPTLKEAAQIMGTSYQNVKQIALKLENKNLMYLEKDKKDGRAIRLTLTPYSQEFWHKTSPKGMEFMKNTFKNIDDEELKMGRRMMQQLLSNSIDLEER